MPPKQVICYVCGRPCLKNSFDIHIIQCKQLFEKRESLKAPKDRRKCPQDPDLMFSSACMPSNSSRKLSASILSSTSKNSSNFNSMTSEISNQPTFAYGLNQCTQCGRKFNDIAYEKHVKICSKVFLTKRKPFDSAKHRALGTDLMEFYRRNKPDAYNKSSMNKTKLNSAITNTRQLQSTNAASFPSITPKSQQIQYSQSNKPSVQASNHGNLPKWKADSLQFRQAMKAARQVTFAEKKSKESGIPLHKLLPSSSSSRGGGNTRGNYSSTSNACNDDLGSHIPADYLQCPTCSRYFNQQAGSRHIPQVRP